MGDKELEASVCLKQGQYNEAARLFEEINQWENALENYEQAHSIDGSVRALASLGRFTDAAERLLSDNRLVQAAQMYKQTADLACASQPIDRQKAATFYQKAAQYFALGGSKENNLKANIRVAEVLSHPLLTITSIDIGVPIIEAHETRMLVNLANTGFGPACNVRVLIYGDGFGKEKPAPAGNRLEVLAKGDTAIIQAGVMPVRPGPNVELELSVTFETMNQQSYTVGPFQAFLMVQEKDARQVGSITIGSFQYIGPGGVNAQDAVMIRPSYQQSSKSQSIPEIVNDLINAEKVSAPKEHIRRAFHCQNCGHTLQPGAPRCSNPECNARLCNHCGSVLGESETTCPVCNEVQTG
jgi:hypothetical protein